MLTTTFRALHEGGACAKRYRYLARELGGIKRYGRETPITLLQILDICGLEDALWALCCTEPEDETERLAQLFACRCVRETPLEDGLVVWDLLTDERSRHAVEVAERYAVGEATADELEAARDAAWDAARAAAEDAAWAAAWAAEATVDHTAEAADWAAWAADWAAETTDWTNGDGNVWAAACKVQTRILREMLEASC